MLSLSGGDNSALPTSTIPVSDSEWRSGGGKTISGGSLRRGGGQTTTDDMGPETHVCVCLHIPIMIHLKSSPIMCCHGKKSACKKFWFCLLPLSQKRKTNEPPTVWVPLLIDIFTTAKTLGGFVLPRVVSPKAVNRSPLRKIAWVKKISPGATTTATIPRENGISCSSVAKGLIRREAPVTNTCLA